MMKPPEHFRIREIKRCFNCNYSDNGINRCTKHNFCYQDFSEAMCEPVCDDWKYKWEDEIEFKKEKTNDNNEINYVVCYKWQEGAELFFDRMVISDFEVKDKDCLDKLENRLTTILSNTGMEEENLATVQITGITQL